MKFEKKKENNNLTQFAFTAVATTLFLHSFPFPSKREAFPVARVEPDG